MEEIKFKQGALGQSLLRNNKQIKEARAIEIIEDAEITFKRKIEDIGREILSLERKKRNMIDLSPTTADSLILASDFDSLNFMQKYLEIGLEIRNKEIQLEILKNDYEALFIGEIEVNKKETVEFAKE